MLSHAVAIAGLPKDDGGPTGLRRPRVIAFCYVVNRPLPDVSAYSVPPRWPGEPAVVAHDVGTCTHTRGCSHVPRRSAPTCSASLQHTSCIVAPRTVLNVPGISRTGVCQEAMPRGCLQHAQQHQGDRRAPPCWRGAIASLHSSAAVFWGSAGRTGRQTPCGPPGRKEGRRGAMQASSKQPSRR
jgi:hypothetical protein